MVVGLIWTTTSLRILNVFTLCDKIQAQTHLRLFLLVTTVKTAPIHPERGCEEGEPLTGLIQLVLSASFLHRRATQEGICVINSD